MSGVPPPGEETVRPGASATQPAAPDSLTPAAVQRRLRSAVFGHRIFYYPSLGSTNDRALELAASEEPEGGLVVAEEQTHGRGRRERTWCSAPYAGIYASLILRPAIPASRAPLLTFMAAVSVADTLNEQVRLRARIKWPNDVLVEGRKVAGVLGEVRGSAPEIREMVVGIGVNVNQTTVDFPPELAGRATSVRMETGAETERAMVLAGVLEGFERRYARFLRDGPAVLLREWESLSTLTPGTRLSVQGPAGLVEGEFTGIDLEGALVVRAPAGSIQRIPFGELLDSLLG